MRVTGRTPVRRDNTTGEVTWREAFTRVDLRLQAPLRWSVNLTVGVDNLLDARLGDDWPGFTGRQAYAGLTWRLGG